MFPLSTPTHSGVLADWLSLAIVVAGLCAFVAGLDDIVRRRGGRHANVDVVTLGAYGALSLVGLAIAVMLAGLRGVPVAQAMFLLIAAWGVIRTALRARSRIRRSTFDIPASTFDVPSTGDVRHATSNIRSFQTLAFAAAACCSLWLWVDVFRDHVGLPSAHDGIVHTAYYLRLLEAGVPTLGRVPIGFARVFGTQFFEFYPTGTHALIAITSGFWGEWGVISHAGILKAWLTLAAAAAPFALLWFVWRLVARMPWWVGLALVFIAIPGFRFPVEAAHEGGMSRIVAHVLMAPIYADVLLGRFEGWRSRPLAGVFLGVAFLMHPGAFVTLAVVQIWATVFSIAADLSWRQRAAAFAGLACVLAVGAGIAVALLRWNGGVALARDAARAFSWPALESRLRGGWKALFDGRYAMGFAPQLLIPVGLVLLVFRRKAFGISWRVALFPMCMVLLAAVALSAQVVPVAGLRLIGGAFYDETPRVLELLYEPIGLAVAAIFWCACSVVVTAASRLGEAGRRLRPELVLPAALAVAAFGYTLERDAWLREHIRFWDRQFETPRISRLGALGTWLETSAEPDAVVFHPAFDSEVWEAWTGRRGIFMYGECHTHSLHVQKSQRACDERKRLVNTVMDSLTWSLDHADPAARCLTEVDRFGRPAYFLVPSSFRSSEPWQTCSDAAYLTTLDGHAVFVYQKR